MITRLESPPRVRIEWLIAGTRVALAGGMLLAIAIDPMNWPFGPGAGQVAEARWPAYLLGWYVVYSLAILALVWTPIRFARGWDVTVHLVDLAVFSLLVVFREGSASPFFIYFIFLVICATLRWQLPGALWTTAAAFTSYVIVALLTAWLLEDGSFSVATLAIRTTYMVVIAALIGYLGTHQQRFQSEMSRLAAWPRKLPRDPRELVTEIFAQSSELLRAPRTVLVWEEPGEEWVNVAWRTDGETQWTEEPEATYGSLVLPGLERTSFQATDVARERGRVLTLSAGSFRRRRCRPVNEALRARFEMRSVQSWPLDGELIRGRMFCLDKPKMRIDDLVVGEVVASLTVSRLESLYLQGRLRQAAALDERIRLARELHDSLLQAQAGAALQLLAARRLLERDPAAARDRLADVQSQLERDELEMRTFITRLRPEGHLSARPPTADFHERLQELRRRVERQWQIHVYLRLDETDTLPDEVLEGAYRLIQEAVVNAARHADASVIDVMLLVLVDGLRLRIADDGRGFPFRGTYDLARLREINQGPLTLKERVQELGGNLTLTSADTGAEIAITLPFAHALR